MNTIQPLQAYCRQYTARHLSAELDRIFLPHFLESGPEPTYDAAFAEARAFISSLLSAVPSEMLPDLVREVGHWGYVPYIVTACMLGEHVGTLNLNNTSEFYLPFAFKSQFIRSIPHSIKSIKLIVHDEVDLEVFETLAQSDLAGNLEVLDVQFDSPELACSDESWNRFQSLKSLIIYDPPSDSSFDLFARAMPHLTRLDAPLSVEDLAAFRDVSTLTHVSLQSGNVDTRAFLQMVLKWPRRDAITFCFSSPDCGSVRALIQSELNIEFDYARANIQYTPEWSTALREIAEMNEPPIIRRLFLNFNDLEIATKYLPRLKVTDLIYSWYKSHHVPAPAELPQHLQSLSIDCRKSGNPLPQSFLPHVDELVRGICSTQTSLQSLSLFCDLLTPAHYNMLLQHLSLLESIKISKLADIHSEMAIYLNHQHLSTIPADIEQGVRHVVRHLPSVHKLSITINEPVTTSIRQLDGVSPISVPNLSSLHMKQSTKDIPAGWVKNQLVPVVASFGSQLKSFSWNNGPSQRRQIRLSKSDIEPLCALHLLQRLSMDNLAISDDALSTLIDSLPRLLYLYFSPQNGTASSLSWLRHPLLMSVSLSEVCLAADQLESACFTKERLPNIRIFNISFGSEEKFQNEAKLTVSGLPHLICVQAHGAPRNVSDVTITDCPALENIVLSRLTLAKLKITNCTSVNSILVSDCQADSANLQDGSIQLEVQNAENVLNALASGTIS